MLFRRGELPTSAYIHIYNSEYNETRYLTRTIMPQGATYMSQSHILESNTYFNSESSITTLILRVTFHIPHWPAGNTNLQKSKKKTKYDFPIQIFNFQIHYLTSLASHPHSLLLTIENNSHFLYNWPLTAINVKYEWINSNLQIHLGTFENGHSIFFFSF